ncbi:hypothetical protein Lepto7375DRAFT_1485 [Leptolyngbya sp. PCC 7375]|nr:hypothetical protein Lepto7375DRAFT_1485 [Leptolyngbya sp. PCC 7375]
MNFSQDFLENTILLVLTAAITGFLVPYILKIIDSRRSQKQKEVEYSRLKEQKQYEASLLRQSKIIDAQVHLLENLASLLWEYQLLAIEVSYYDSFEQPKLYTAAVDEYEEKTGVLFAKIRAEISKSLRLTRAEIYEELKKLYYEQLLPLDQRLYLLMRKQRSEEKRITEWGKFNEYAVHTLAEIVDETLDHLARELHLKGEETGYKSIYTSPITEQSSQKLIARERYGANKMAK